MLRGRYSGLDSRRADEQDGIVQRYISESAMGRDISDMDAHPMTKSRSLDDEDLKEEIRETLAGEGDRFLSMSQAQTCFL